MHAEKLKRGVKRHISRDQLLTTALGGRRNGFWRWNVLTYYMQMNWQAQEPDWSDPLVRVRWANVWWEEYNTRRRRFMRNYLSMRRRLRFADILLMPIPYRQAVNNMLHWLREAQGLPGWIADTLWENNDDEGRNSRRMEGRFDRGG